jgi:Family of unknown function (DUF5675)
VADVLCRLAVKTVAIREDGCFGVLLWDGRPFAVSLERTFDDLRPVIQAGIHRCTRSFYNKGQYPTFEIEVPGHTRVLFHKGNVEMHSEACVLVAESFGVLKGVTAVLDSSGGFSEFMELTRGLNEFYAAFTGR